MSDNTFIGMGRNPHGPDLPLGMGMRLMQDPQAREAFGRLTRAKQTDLIDYVQGGSTGDEAKTRMEEAIDRLRGEF